MSPPLSRRIHPRVRSRLRSLVLSLCALAPVLLAGCTPADEVREYDAPKPQGEGIGKNRILAAIFVYPDKVWNVKLVGPTPTVAELEPDFYAFIGKLHYADGKITLPELPPGWKKMPEGALREAGYYYKEEDGPELTVASLAAANDGDLIKNINRWRGQLSRRPIIREEEAATFTTEKKLDGAKVYIVDLTGKGPGKTAKQERPRPPIDVEPDEPANFQYGKPLPPGWFDTGERGSPQFPREATFSVSEGKKEALITVAITDANPSMLEQVQRWAPQVGLPKPAREADLASIVTRCKVDNEAGELIDLRGPQQSMLVAFVPHRGRFWTFKMMGSADLVEKQRVAFGDFLRSVRFEGGR